MLTGALKTSPQISIFCLLLSIAGTIGEAFGWGTMPTGREVPSSIPGRVHGNFQWALLPLSLQQKWVPKNWLWGKVRPACSCAACQNKDGSLRFLSPSESSWLSTGMLNSDSLRAGRSGDRIPVGARFSAPIQIGPGFHLASYTMGTGSLSRG